MNIFSFFYALPRDMCYTSHNNDSESNPWSSELRVKNVIQDLQAVPVKRYAGVSL